MSDPYAPMKAHIVTDEENEEQVARVAAAAGPLAQSVRDLIDAVIRSEVPVEELDAIRSEVGRLVARLRVAELPGPFGARVRPDGTIRTWGNAVVGLRNATAPPLKIVCEDDGLVWAETVLGARFEGPPGLVHGGISALLLDQMVGEAAAAGGTAGMTGTLKVRYRRPTPLGPIRLEARVERVDGVKAIVRAGIYVLAEVADETSAERAGASGPGTASELCVEAEGVMIAPRWAREQVEATGAEDA